MVKVVGKLKSRVRFHLGYTGMYAGIPEGDAAQFEEACNEVPDNYTLKRVEEACDRCDRVYELTEANRVGFTSKELISGDINRAVIKTRNDQLRFIEEAYLAETDKLALILWVPNFRREDSARYRLERGGGSYVMAIPGPADTSVASSLVAVATYA